MKDLRITHLVLWGNCEPILTLHADGTWEGDVDAAVERIRKDERERIAAWLEENTFDLPHSPHPVFGNLVVDVPALAQAIRNGEHETRSNDHPTSDNCTNDSQDAAQTTDTPAHVADK